MGHAGSGKRETDDGPGTPSDPRRGVWRCDAAPGQIGLVVYNSRGVRLLRIEFAEEAYSSAWWRWLERRLAKWDPRGPALSIVK